MSAVKPTGHRYDGCPDCKRLVRIQRRERLHRRMADRVEIDGRLTVVAPGVAHGTPSTYGNWGCQCRPCTEAQRVAMAAARERRRSRRVTDDQGRLVTRVPDVRHGSDSTYTNWGCQCAPCTEAWRATAAYERERRP